MAKYYLKGLDNGYMFTKDNEFRIFKSAYTSLDEQVYEEREIIIDGKKYYFGTGTMCTDEDKISSEMNMVCTLANLAMTGEHEYILCANLPISQWKDKRDKFKETITGYNKHEVIYNGKKQNFKIVAASVYPQGVSSIYVTDSGLSSEKIIFDVGSKTINIALFEVTCGDGGKDELRVTHYLTLYKGILNLYEKIIKQVNRKFDLSLDKERARYIFSHGLCVDGVNQDISFLNEIIVEYILDILVDFKKEFPQYKTTPIYIVGGGAEVLYPVLKKSISSIIKVPNPQFSNALGLYVKGRVEYQKFL